MRFVAPLAGLAVAMAAAFRVYTLTFVFFAEKLVPLPAFPYAVSASFVAFCASMTLWAGIAHLIAVLCSRTNAGSTETREASSQVRFPNPRF